MSHRIRQSLVLAMDTLYIPMLSALHIQDSQLEGLPELKEVKQLQDMKGRDEQRAQANERTQATS